MLLQYMFLHVLCAIKKKIIQHITIFSVIRIIIDWNVWRQGFGMRRMQYKVSPSSTLT